MTEKDFDNLTPEEVDRLFGVGKPFDKEKAMREATLYLKVQAESIIGAGKCLLIIQAHEEESVFLRVASKAGIPLKAVPFVMEAAEKFGNKLTPRPIGHVNDRGCFILDRELSKILDNYAEAVYGDIFREGKEDGRQD